MPSTRTGGASSIDWMNSLSGSASSDSRSISTLRPRFQVVSSVNTIAPIDAAGTSRRRES